MAQQALVVERKGGTRVGHRLVHGDGSFLLPEWYLHGANLEAVRRPA